MKTIPQYVDKQGHRFYYSFSSVFCSKCKEKIDEFVVVVCEWDKKKSEVYEFCFNCSKDHKQIGLCQEKFVMCLVSKKPLNSQLVLISPPELVPSNKDSSLFSNSLDCPRVVNRCKRSGHRDYTCLDDSASVVVGVVSEKHEDDLVELEEGLKKLKK